MKKLYIYLLVGVISFFGFSIGVEAEYNRVCQYTGSYDSDSSYTVEVGYDSSNNKSYNLIISKVNLTGLQTNLSEKKLHEVKFNYDGKKNDVGSGIFIYGNLGSTSCPKNVTVPTDVENSIGTLVFYDSLTGSKSAEIKNKINSGYCSGRTNSMDRDCNQYITLSGSYSPIKSSNEGRTCVVPFEIRIDDGDVNYCFVSFTDTGSGLSIKYLPKEYGSSAPTEEEWNNVSPLSSGGTSFDCGLKTVTVNNKGESKTTGDSKMLHLTNSNMGIKKDTNGTSILISTRSQFDDEFLKKWTGDSCNGIVNTNAESYNNNFYVLFPEAQEYCKENDCKSVNEETFVDLKTFTYEWPKWYNTTYETCEDLIGSDLKEVINDILLYVRILVPILLIGLGVADFVKAMIATEEGAMKKAQNKFLKRLIIAAVIFLIPSLTNLLFNLLNGVWAHINNSACNIWN